MRYYRIHTEDTAYLTKQPRGLFTAVGKLVDAKLLTEEEEKEYWRNRAYFEKVLPVPPYYEQGNPEGAITWYKDNDKANRIFYEMVFYRRIADKYGKKLLISECEEIPGTLVYEDDYQIAVKDQKPDTKISTKELPWPVRAIEDKDIADCVTVIRKSFSTVADEFGFTQENAPRFTAFATDEKRIYWQLNGEHRPMFGYFENNELIGYYSLSVQTEQECELNNLSVLPDQRHKNIGKILMFDALSRAAEMGFTKMNLGIVEENKVLRKWYEDLGYVHTGTQKFDFFPFTCGYMSKNI